MSRKLLYNELRDLKRDLALRYKFQRPQHIFITMRMDNMYKNPCMDTEQGKMRE